MLFYKSLDLDWPSVKPRADQGHFGHFSKKRHFGYSGAQTGWPCHSRCSHGPVDRKWYFWIFRGPTQKLRADKIQYQQSILISFSYRFDRFNLWLVASVLVLASLFWSFVLMDFLGFKNRNQSCNGKNMFFQKNNEKRKKLN